MSSGDISSFLTNLSQIIVDKRIEQNMLRSSLLDFINKLQIESQKESEDQQKSKDLLSHVNQQSSSVNQEVKSERQDLHPQQECTDKQISKVMPSSKGKKPSSVNQQHSSVNQEINHDCQDKRQQQEIVVENNLKEKKPFIPNVDKIKNYFQSQLNSDKKTFKIVHSLKKCSQDLNDKLNSVEDVNKNISKPSIQNENMMKQDSSIHKLNSLNQKRSNPFTNKEEHTEMKNQQNDKSLSKKNQKEENEMYEEIQTEKIDQTNDSQQNNVSQNNLKEEDDIISQLKNINMHLSKLDKIEAVIILSTYNK